MFHHQIDVDERPEYVNDVIQVISVTEYESKYMLKEKTQTRHHCL
jgi:hypothetical protein